MADTKSKEARSLNMSRVRNKNTGPEELVCKYLFSHGFRYRKNVKKFPGTPDIVLPKYKTVIFVNGCFWHAHTNCKAFSWPKDNADFWRAKITQNIERDARNVEQLRSLGWYVETIWTCQLRVKKRDETLSALVNQLKKNYEIK